MGGVLSGQSFREGWLHAVALLVLVADALPARQSAYTEAEQCKSYLDGA